MELIDRYNEIKNAYDESDVRPFLCEEHVFLDDNNHMSYIELYVKLATEGLDIVLHSNWNLLDWCISNGDYHQCSKLISLYKTTTIISVDLDTDPNLINLLRGGCDVRLVLPSCNNLTSPISVMNVVENMKHYNEILEVPLCDECQLLRQYLELFNIPFLLEYDYDNVVELSEYHTAYRSFTKNEINSMNHEDLTYILINAINEGRYRLANIICNKGSFSITIDDIRTLIGFNTLFELIESDVDITVDNLQSIFIKFINIDTDLEFCNRPTVNKYWNSVDVEAITNTQALDLLMIRCIPIPSCDSIIESLDKYKTCEEYIGRIKLCNRIYHYSSEVKSANITKLIVMLDRFDGDIDEKRAVNNAIMSLITSLIYNELVDIHEYKNTHPYIDFLIK